MKTTPKIVTPDPGPDSPNSGTLGQQTTSPLTAPTTINANFDGITQGSSNCGNCQPPDPNAAVGTTQILHAVNLREQVYSKTGVLQCGFGLNTFLGTTERLSDPRVQYDSSNNRFSMVVIPIPASPTAAPAMFVAVSQTANACGGWFVYRLTFSGALFPAGALLDYPYLGQDQTGVLISSNNFRYGTNGTNGAYFNSTAAGISKANLYAGAAVSFPAFAVAFSTAPVTVGGTPIPATANTYFLASAPGFGYRLYRMNSAHTSLVLQANIASNFSAPTRRVNQPGTGVTLDPLDGRIVWSPYQIGNFVWFTHGIDLSGFPTIRYGAINTSTNTPTVALAYRSGTSDDFNPSIGVSPAGANIVNIFLNWAFTDTPRGIPTSVTVDGVRPGGGVPNLIGTGVVLVQGSSTTTNTRFGDYSSVAIDPTSVNGCTAVVAQEYFTSTGQWRTRLARLGFC